MILRETSLKFWENEDGHDSWKSQESHGSSNEFPQVCW